MTCVGSVRQLEVEAVQQEPRFLAERPANSAEPSLDYVFVDGLEIQTIIGIDPDELTEPQPLRIDLTLGRPALAACHTDHIGDTVDYGDIVARMKLLMAEHGCKLLERLADLIASILVLEFQADWVRVRLTKPGKLGVLGLGVQIERTRLHFAPKASLPGCIHESPVGSLPSFS